MKAIDKFEKRARELNLWDEWCENGHGGRVATTTKDGIVFLVHEDTDDKYSEFLFPHISVMEKSDDFRMRALYDFCDHTDDNFIYRLCRWVARPDVNACPLYPLDVYFLWDNPEITDFEDDEDEDDEELNQYCNHCDSFVHLEEKLEVQRCPECGKWIVPCSICPLKECSKHCPLDRYATILNKE